MTEHTDLPWIWREVANAAPHNEERVYDIFAISPQGLEFPVARVHGDNAVWLAEGAAVANAKLIASAPDLLAERDALRLAVQMAHSVMQRRLVSSTLPDNTDLQHGIKWASAALAFDKMAKKEAKIQSGGVTAPAKVIAMNTLYDNLVKISKDALAVGKTAQAELEAVTTALEESVRQVEDLRNALASISLLENESTSSAVDKMREVAKRARAALAVSKKAK